MPDTPLRCLLVGAGSVGQIYGYHLQQGGARVRYMVRSTYVQGNQNGFTLHRFKGGSPTTLHFTPDCVSDDLDALVEDGVDVVVLCVSYAGMRGAWLGELMEKIGDATVFTLVPGQGARALLLKHLPEARLVTGMITLLGYPAPLPSQTLTPGTAYWFPPFMPCPIDGPPARARAIIRALQQGGQPARHARGLDGQSAWGTAALMPIVAGLEMHDWSFERLATDGTVATAAAIREALDVVGASLQRTPPLWRVFMRPFVLRTALWLVPKFVPFSFEDFMALHFQKVGAQTRLLLDEWVALADAEGRAITHLRAQHEFIHALHGDIDKPAG